MSPPARSGASLLNIGHGDLILFGGLSETGQSLNDTWQWDGSNWTQLHPAASPPARFDAAGTGLTGGKAVLFGGSNSNGQVFGDTWLWSDGNWSEIHSADAHDQSKRQVPSPRFGASMSRGPGGTAVLVGGSGPGGTVFGDTWIWNGNTWLSSNSKLPLGLTKAAMAYDRSIHAFVLFGGSSSTNESNTQDTTWVLSIARDHGQPGTVEHK